MEPIHLFLALVEQPEGVVPGILQRLGVALATATQEAEKAIDQLPKVGGSADQYISPA